MKNCLKILSLWVVIALVVESGNVLAYPSLVTNIANLHCKMRVSVAGGQSAYSQGLYEQLDEMVQENCIACHREGGVAPGAGADLRLRPTSDPTHLDFNFANFFSLATDRGGQHILNKALGSAHGGGAVLDAFSNDYKMLSDFVGSLGDSSYCDFSNSAVKEDTKTPENLWQGASALSPPELFRKAAIVLGRRIPTSQEIEDLENGDTEVVDAIRDLMQGDGFHQFLITGANDQLLTDAFMNGLFPIEMHGGWWPGTGITKMALYENSGGDEDLYLSRIWPLWIANNYGHARAPVELIAHVVENDRPYTEILTADYTMVTPLTADILNAQLDQQWEESVIYNGEYSEFHKKFLPGKNFGTYVTPPTGEEACVPVEIDGECYATGWEPFQWPHAGVLNTIAFLQRYPTTETNRNRARARWAYKLFLGVDIEASAARTTDAEALADTNNPTLLNPACTVCHRTLDPVAGTFQNYSALGYFRENNHMDSLPYAYVVDPESGYIEGDTWFRDMRPPGFAGKVAPDAWNSLQWLADHMVNDPRFPVGTVEFWWPAVMGRDVLRAPEDPALPNYTQQLAAFNFQRHEINQLASSFVANGYSLKQLLLEMVVSPWFSSGEAVSADLALFSAAGLGTRRLLTPEELDAKTLSLFGWRVDEKYSGDGVLPETWTFISRRANIVLGGIDSYQVKSRARDVSAISLQAIEQHAAAVSCVVVEIEAETVDGHRRFLNTINFSDPIEDNADVRAILAKLYKRLHGRRVDIHSDEVDLTIDLLLEAYQNSAGDPGCYKNDYEGYKAMASQLDSRGVRQSRDRSDVAFANILAWRLLFDYLLSHYDYVNE